LKIHSNSVQLKMRKLNPSSLDVPTFTAAIRRALEDRYLLLKNSKDKVEHLEDQNLFSYNQENITRAQLE
jgi:hypothetical protein